MSSADAAGAAAALEQAARGAQSVAPDGPRVLPATRRPACGCSQNRPRDAATAAREAVAIGRDSGLPPMQIPHFLVRQALCLVRWRDDRRRAGALRRGDRARRPAPTGATSSSTSGLLRAHLALARRRRDDGARAAARPAARVPRAPLLRASCDCPPTSLTPLLALALAHGIEPDYVRDLIRQRAAAAAAAPTRRAGRGRWRSARSASSRSPRDGEPLVSKGKAQKKPLELLKALVAHGGRSVDAAMLTALLWPDAEGDDAKTSFDSNLYRLRKLRRRRRRAAAGGRQAVAQPGAWSGVDTWAFEARARGRAHDVDAALRAATAAISWRSRRRPPWALPVRDRLQAQLVARRAGGGRRAAKRARRLGRRARALRARARSRQPGRGDLPPPHDLPARERAIRPAR